MQKLQLWIHDPEYWGEDAITKEPYKARIIRDCNIRVSHQPFKLGDLVIKSMEAIGKYQGKLGPK